MEFFHFLFGWDETRERKFKRLGEGGEGRAIRKGIPGRMRTEERERKKKKESWSWNSLPLPPSSSSSTKKRKMASYLLYCASGQKEGMKIRANPSLLFSFSSKKGGRDGFLLGRRSVTLEEE